MQDEKCILTSDSSRYRRKREYKEEQVCIIIVQTGYLINYLLLEKKVYKELLMSNNHMHTLSKYTRSRLFLLNILLFLPRPEGVIGGCAQEGLGVHTL